MGDSQTKSFSERVKPCLCKAALPQHAYLLQTGQAAESMHKAL